MNMGVFGNYTQKARAVIRYPRLAASVMYRQFMYRFHQTRLLGNGKAHFLPCEIVALISRKCFLNCITCGTKALYGSDDRFEDFMATEVVRRMADELSKWPTPIYIKMTGGEPTMHPEFYSIIDYFAYKKVPVRLSTNGVVFKNRENAEALVRSGIDTITISMDGLPQDHNRIRRGHNLFHTLELAISNIQEARKKRGTHLPMIQVACVISMNNYEGLPDFVSELARIGVDWLHFSFIQYMLDEWGLETEKVTAELGGLGDRKWVFWRDNPIPNLNMDMDKLADVLAEIFKTTHPFPVTMINIGGRSTNQLNKWHCTDDPIHTSLCANPYVSMVVLSPGFCSFCIDFPQFYYGDIRAQSLREAWFSENAQMFRRKFRDYYCQKGANLPHCLRCGWRFW